MATHLIDIGWVEHWWPHYWVVLEQGEFWVYLVYIVLAKLAHLKLNLMWRLRARFLCLTRRLEWTQGQIRYELLLRRLLSHFLFNRRRCRLGTISCVIQNRLTKLCCRWLAIFTKLWLTAHDTRCAFWLLAIFLLCFEVFDVLPYFAAFLHFLSALLGLIWWSVDDIGWHNFDTTLRRYICRPSIV